ncbi:UTP--glucose-1-phosphate uridylyltransferase [Sphingomonas aerolata]|uniref:UTP--glucose-1-phosphate uridylyltransferase n=1 Tax=Sphingomonas aerolata TaxID=185951 RepID=UPI002FE1010E
MTIKPLRKAVFPVAGLGTRFLPATKSMPKEMLTVVDKPLIQYAVEEGAGGGIEQIIFVTGRGKVRSRIISTSPTSSRATMRARGKSLTVLDGIRQKPGSPVYVRQQEPLGLGHAVWCARDIVGDEPFAVLLPDELMVGKPGFMKQMVEAYNKVGGNVIGALEVADSETDKYGIISPGATDGRLTEVTALIEKPAKGTSPSNLMIPGRYILQPEVMRILEGQEKGAGGEIQLTDAMAQLIGNQPFHGFTFDGQRYDCGDKAGYIQANLALALARDDIGPVVRAFAKTLLG